MHIFIVHAHPEPQSFNHALTAMAQQVLSEQGHEVKVSDLYRMNFDAVSSRKNYTTCKDANFFKPQLEEVYAYEHDGFIPEIKAEMEKLVWCDMLIFQFPLWWFSLPAILKGWVDRVFAMGFAYGGGRIYDKGVFRGKRAMLSLTTGGPERMYKTGGFNGDIDTILFHIQHGMLYFVGMEVLPPFIVYSPAKSDQDQRGEYLSLYRERLLSLATTRPIRFEDAFLDVF